MREILITFCDMIWPVVRIAHFVLEDVIEWPEEYTLGRFRRLGHGILVHKPSYTFRLEGFHSFFQERRHYEVFLSALNLRCAHVTNH